MAEDLSLEQGQVLEDAVLVLQPLLLLKDLVVVQKHGSGPQLLLVVGQSFTFVLFLEFQLQLRPLS